MLIITFQNDRTGSVETGNYIVRVRSNARIVRAQRIQGHQRVDGWEELVRLWVAQWERQAMTDTVPAWRLEWMTGCKNKLSEKCEQLQAEIEHVLQQYADLKSCHDEHYAGMLAARVEIERLEGLLESLTPGGSEFHDGPARCAAWVRSRLQGVIDQIKRRQEAEVENEELRTALSLLYHEILAKMTLEAMVANPGSRDFELDDYILESSSGLWHGVETARAALVGEGEREG